MNYVREHSRKRQIAENHKIRPERHSIEIKTEEVMKK